MATPENIIQDGRELKLVPDIKTKQGGDIMLGVCTLLNSDQRNGPGVIGIFEKPLNDAELKPKPIGYLIFTVGPSSIVCSMANPLRDMALNSNLPYWVSEINKIASTGNGLQATPMDKTTTTEIDESGRVEIKSKSLPRTEYTNLGLGELLVTQLESYAKSIGIKKIQFQDANEYAGKLLNRLGYKGRLNLEKSLD